MTGVMRIGCGAGFSSDRLDGAVDLARDGELDALVFECVGERTLAFGHRDRKADPTQGYNPQLEARLKVSMGVAQSLLGEIRSGDPVAAQMTELMQALKGDIL